jgi:hypothetical protein
MPRGNIELYWQKAEMAPEGVTAQLLVTDGNGSDYLLPYPCTLKAEGWVNTAPGKPLGGASNLLELYVETLPKRNLPNLRRRRGTGGRGSPTQDHLPEGYIGAT